MVDITELPLTGKMKEKFNIFFQEIKQLGIPLDKIDFDGYEYRKDVSSNCDICGHAIKQRLKFKSQTKHPQKWELGVCCASNLRAIQGVKGDIDKLNFDRKVVLEKKTILKRMREFEEEQSKIQLEIQKKDVLDFLNDFHKKLVKLCPHKFGVRREGDEPPSDLSSDHNNQGILARDTQGFLLSIRLSTKRGQLTDNQEKAVRKYMERGLDNVFEEVKTKVREKERKDDLHRKSLKVVYTYIEECLGTRSREGQWFPKVWKGYQEFLQSIRTQFREKGFLSEKQIKAVEKIHDKVCKNEECRQRSWS
jgi:hypothetical protein